MKWNFGKGWNGENRYEESSVKWHARNLKKCLDTDETADPDYYQQAQERILAKKKAVKSKNSIEASLHSVESSATKSGIFKGNYNS